MTGGAGHSSDPVDRKIDHKYGKLETTLAKIDACSERIEQRLDHFEQAINRGFDRMFTRADFYFGLLMLTCAQTGIFALLLALFDYGGQP